MLKEIRAPMQFNNNVSGIAAGLFLGGMIGAAAMLLYAPQSGKRTRVQIQQKGFELRDQTAEILEDARAQMEIESKKIARSGRHKVKELMRQGQELVSGQLAHVTEIVEIRKKKILGS
jgi:gas vesicle protein